MDLLLVLAGVGIIYWFYSAKKKKILRNQMTTMTKG